MKYLNQIQLIGYATEPKLTDVAHGKMGTFSVITKRYAGKNEAGDGTFLEDWHNCQTFGRMAENLKIRKGDFIYVSGELRTNKKDGVVYYNVHVDKLNILLKKVTDTEYHAEEDTEQEE
ncbi:MAG: Single-stranded DNA-binding protein [Syntrophorhabdus sp. PtaU1.Bin153]|nr:MAG: Single-stranded DNA-binding protein [Syntrophorhabdus sp. PtaU1.Bin153]